MTHKRIFLSAALIAMLTCTGCSKSRWLSRNDYSEMHDPFMENESAVAETPAVPRAGDQSGRARLDDSETGSVSMAQAPASRSTASSAPLSGPKPIMQASGSAAGRSPVSQASYPQEPGSPPSTAPRNNLVAKKGPSLSDFMSQPASGADTPSGVAAPSGAAAGMQAGAAPMASAGAGDAGFMNWANQQAPAAAVRTAAATAAAPVTQGFDEARVIEDSLATEAKKDAEAVFGEIERAEPLIPSTANHTVPAAFGSAAPPVNSASMSRELSTPSAATSIPKSSVIPQTSRTSTPPGLNPFEAMESPAIPRTTQTTIQPSTASPVPDFDTPEEMDVAPAKPSAFGETIRPVKPAESSGLDADFMNDTGWKPASLTRP